MNDEQEPPRQRQSDDLQAEPPADLEIISGMPAGDDEDDEPKRAQSSIEGLLTQAVVRPLFVEPERPPSGDPVSLADSPVVASECWWPLVTQHPERLTVSCVTAVGNALGRPGRKFLAPRNGGARHHVGLDLFAYEGDVVRACEDGRIANFYRFYASSSGEETYALFIQHAGFAVNYGEVKSISLGRFGLKIGDQVTAGDSIAVVSSTAMTHFEVYQSGTTQNERWMTGEPKPQRLLNPTRYLLQLAASAKL